MMDIEKTSRSLATSFLPSSTVRKRLMAEANEPDRSEHIETIPPTAPYMPKSVSPNALRTTLEV